MITTSVGETAWSSKTTSREDWITLMLSAWPVGGLFLDGYAHVNIIDTATEDFLTPWHAVLYSGFAAFTAWIGVIGYRRRHPAPSPRDWFPPAYQLTLLGLVLFAVGGVGDAVWHTVFGVEVGIDALLSPTHLILFAGSVLLLWTPARSSAERGDVSPWLAVGAAALTTSLLLFVFQFQWLVPNLRFAQEPFDATTGAGTGTVQLFLASAIVASAVLVGPVRLIGRRWTLPVGSTALIWGTAATLESVALSQVFWPVVVVIVAGLVSDLVLVGTRNSSRLGAHSTMAAAFSGPAALFAGYLILARLDGPLGWPPEIWAGVIVVAGAVGAGLVVVERAGSVEPVSG